MLREIRESALEREFVRQCTAAGAKVRKYASPGTRGVADRLVFFRGRCYLVELKRPSTDLEPLQIYEATQMRMVGFETHRVRTLAEVGQFVLAMKLNK